MEIADLCINLAIHNLALRYAELIFQLSLASVSYEARIFPLLCFHFIYFYNLISLPKIPITRGVFEVRPNQTEEATFFNFVIWIHS
jgi:hypothetical protein